MFCRNCGKEIADDVKFCNFCGQPVQAAPTQPAVEQPQVQAPMQQQNNKKLIWVIIGVAAAFLIVAIVFGILILGKLSGDDDKSDKEEVKTEKSVDEDEEILDDANDEESEEADEDMDEAAEEAADTDDVKAYLAERFPELTKGYETPKSDNTFWMPIEDDIRSKLDALDNDYNKVAWVVEYSFRQMPTLVVSCTINENCGVPYMFIAFTNVGDKPVSIDGTADIYDLDNVLLTSGYPYTGMLQPGGTYMCPIACPDIDENDVDFGFTDLKIDFPAAKAGSYSSTAEISGSAGSSITTSISLENTGDKMENMGQVTVILLDEKGMPVANGYVFSATSTNPGEFMETDVQIGILDSDIDLVEDIAVFASPYITG